MPRKTNKGRRIPGRVRALPVFGRMSLSKGQEQALDTLWSAAVKARAWQTCEKCLKSGIRLESHHFYGRRNKTLRHMVSNGFSLCHTHHRWAEEQPAEFLEWAIKKRGQQWFEELRALSHVFKTYREYAVIKTYLESFI